MNELKLTLPLEVIQLKNEYISRKIFGNEQPVSFT